MLRTRHLEDGTPRVRGFHGTSVRTLGRWDVRTLGGLKTSGIPTHSRHHSSMESHRLGPCGPGPGAGGGCGRAPRSGGRESGIRPAAATRPWMPACRDGSTIVPPGHGRPRRHWRWRTPLLMRPARSPGVPAWMETAAARPLRSCPARGAGAVPCRRLRPLGAPVGAPSRGRSRPKADPCRGPWAPWPVQWPTLLHPLPGPARACRSLPDTQPPSLSASPRFTAFEPPFRPASQRPDVPPRFRLKGCSEV